MPTLLVFGARNLGRAIANHFSGKGWDIAAFAASEETLSRLRQDVPSALGICGDAGCEHDVERAFAETRERFRSVDLVVVAISPRTRRGGIGGGTIAEASGEAIAPYVDELIPNLFTILRLGAHTLSEQGRGTYVQITGGSARRGMPGRGPWAAGAFATRALIQAAASELREQGIHVALLIVDGTIASEKTAQLVRGQPDAATLGEEDVARAVAYLAEQSPRAWTHELQITPSRDRWVP